MWQLTFVVQPRWQLPPYTWGQERELCKRCVHYCERIGGARNAERNVVMVCALNKSRTGGRGHGTCIDMRYDGGCGLSGKLFEPRE